MNKISNTFLIAILALVLVSCGDSSTKEVSPKSDRSVQYFPNMYESVGYETYQEGDIFPGDVEAQKPVEGTVSRGWMPYDYEDDNDGYASAKANLKNPVPLTEAHLTNGQALYSIYCAICHGSKGDGQGHLVTTEKILGVPSYDAREITEGSIYHVMYYGINYMGSYASQTSIEERWEITHYVEALRADLMGVARKPVLTEDGKMVAPETPAAQEETDSLSTQNTDKDSEIEADVPPTTGSANAQSDNMNQGQ
ncbi:c-type cytochrome [Nonlabens agnitus]|uniref:Cytochrome c family protein n=1 Tax=Nonlabens agnitus TaxID=870484 RepID=A0A2S9WWX7_9FLAO|nr:cytochrome c [Nonlabens agnitus]PRP67987.1 cytochrome c family protein [Nonlabens agnitus]